MHKKCILYQLCTTSRNHSVYTVTPHVLITIIRLIRVISANSHDYPPNQNFSRQLGPDRSDRWSQPVWPVEPMSTVLGLTTFKSLSHSLSLISSLLTTPAPSLSRAPSSPNPLPSFKSGSRIILSMCSSPGWRGISSFSWERSQSR